VGPIDLTIRAHEITFITGGNGSGKSTFLKLLTGLYQPTSGVIKVDKVPIDETNREIYRNMISTVFSDYHLFKRLYGLRNIDHQEINELLREMELEEKTGLVDNEFETLELSNGQKKRLALLVSLLEDRPIFVFDEWAADQDPGFRRKFYKELLQKLKEKGKTIIAVTHDDRYFDVADRLLKMEEGKVTEERDGKTSDSQ
jgi:putative ATP-binding cassette transporter